MAQVIGIDEKVATYIAMGKTTAEGVVTPLKVFDNGTLATAEEDGMYSSAAVESSARENSHQIATSAKRLIRISGYNYGPVQYIQAHDVASTPADGATPKKKSFPIQSHASFEFEPDGYADSLYVNGIYVCNSSTEFTKTIGSADCVFTVEVV